MRRERHTPRCRELRTGRRWDNGFHGRPTCGVYLAVIRSSSAVLCLAPAGRRCSSIFEFSARLCKVEEQALTRADHCSPSASTQGSYGSPGRFAVIMSQSLPRDFCTCRLQMAGRRRDCGSHGKHALPTAPRYVAKATCQDLGGGMILPMLSTGEEDTTHQPANSTFSGPERRILGLCSRRHRGRTL